MKARVLLHSSSRGDGQETVEHLPEPLARDAVSAGLGFEFIRASPVVDDGLAQSAQGLRDRVRPAARRIVAARLGKHTPGLLEPAVVHERADGVAQSAGQLGGPEPGKGAVKRRRLAGSPAVV